MDTDKTPPEDPESTKADGGLRPTETALPADTSRTGATPIPESIGQYRVLSKLGEGGMGVVYEAEQQNPRRRVAVKVIRGGRFVDHNQLRMFQREVDALALLKHPNIAGIYESGCTDEGRHFFAMELVRGETLDAYLARRSETPQVQPAASAAEQRFRLLLFMKIADAVHYAHQRGVIHRDLKPSNIVVLTPDESENPSLSTGASSGARARSEVPETKVLDFGLARMTEGDVHATQVTEVGAIKGTLSYMSPEQTRGNPDEIDMRSDVYTLGVILYEMLVGRRPYDVLRMSLVEAIRVICEEPPQPLRHSMSGRTKIDSDVETIVGKALEKQAGRRYASTAALTEDVARYLDSQPILARPSSASYQLRKFAARNRVLVGGIAATIAMLVIGAVVSTMFGLREAAHRRAAEAARVDMQTVVDFQSSMLRNVNAQKMGRGLYADLSQRASAVASPAQLAMIDGIFRKINMTDAALKVLDENVLGRAAISIETQFGSQPLIKAQLYRSLGETFLALGFLDKSEDYTSRSLEIHEREQGPEHLETLAAQVSLAWTLERQGRLAEAKATARAAYEIASRVLGDEHNVTLSALTRMAVAMDRLNEFEEALEIWTRLYEIRRRQLGDDNVETAWMLHSIGTIHRLAGRPDESEPILLEALEAFQRVQGVDHHDTLWAKGSLASTYHAQGRLDEAEPMVEDVLDKRRRMMGEHHQETLEMMSFLGAIYLDQGKLEQAEPLLRDALARSRRIIGDNHRETLWTMLSLSKTLVGQGRYEDALPLYEEAVRGREQLLGRDDPWTANDRRGLAELYEKLDRHDEAKSLLDG